MNERITYIDSLKGLAILLMVMGHVIARQIPAFHVVAESGPRNVMILFRMIYSFHMPLLMFCSGLFALRICEYSWGYFCNTVWKKIQTLLFPFFAAGLIEYITIGPQFLEYWFLWMLFLFILLVLVIDGMCSLIPKYGQLVSSILIISLAIFVHLCYRDFMSYHKLPFADIVHWKLFPYFCIGVICARYDLCTKWFSCNWVFSIALLFFGLLTYWCTINGFRLPKASITHYFTEFAIPTSAIIALVYLFKVGLANTTSRGMIWLQDIGCHSLEIYLIHSFFLFRMHPIGEFVLKGADTIGGESIFVIQLVSSLLFSIIIIWLSYIVMNIINKSHVLSLLLLGRKSKI